MDTKISNSEDNGYFYLFLLFVFLCPNQRCYQIVKTFVSFFEKWGRVQSTNSIWGREREASYGLTAVAVSAPTRDACCYLILKSSINQLSTPHPLSLSPSSSSSSSSCPPPSPPPPPHPSAPRTPSRTWRRSPRGSCAPPPPTCPRA